MADPRQIDGTPEGNPDDGSGDSKGGIPKERVDAMLAKAKAAALDEGREAEQRRGAIELQREREARQAAELAAQQPAVPPQTDPTVQDLQALVNDGVITEAQMQLQLQTQREKAQDARIDDRVKTASTEQALLAKLNTEMDEYLELEPDLKNTSSEVLTRVEAEITEMGKRGVARSLQSELMALRIVLGPLQKLRTTKRTAAERETDATGAAAGGGDGAEEVVEEGAAVPEGIPKRLQTYYQGMIQKGFYSGWDDPKVVRQLKGRGGSTQAA